MISMDTIRALSYIALMLLGNTAAIIIMSWLLHLWAPFDGQWHKIVIW